MRLEAVASPETVGVPFPRSFASWRTRLDVTGVPPVLAIAGSRGKTTVVRLVDAICRSAGLRTVLWTDQGVEIDGRPQRGELLPWTRALERLAAGSLDVAIQELDWDTVHAVGLPPRLYPVVAVTNLCVNSDSCLIQAETLRARRSLTSVRAAARGDGTLILNGEDFAVAASSEPAVAATVLVAQSRETPLLRGHLERGGTAAWTTGGNLVIGTAAASRIVGSQQELALALGGPIGFQFHNALTAATIALSCGIPRSTIANALQSVVLPNERMPGSFNLVTLGETLVVVERPAPSWFLRPSLRVLPHLGTGRTVVVVGALAGVPDDDLVETGRLLGRHGAALLMHGQERDSARAELLRQGIASNEVPPVMIQARSEAAAVTLARARLRPNDVLFVLADRPEKVLRQLQRAATDSLTP